MAAPARQDIEGDNGDEFLEKLMTSNVITIRYVNANGNPAELNLLQALAYKASRRIRSLCKQLKDTFTISDLLRESQSDFISRLNTDDSDFTDLLACFTKWLYSGLIATDVNCQHDLWYFGQRIESPRFQNAVTRKVCQSLSARLGDDVDSVFFDAYDLQKLWDFAYPKHPKEDEIAASFETQKMVLFALDYLVFLGSEDYDVKQVIYAGRALAVQLYKRIVDTAASLRTGEVRRAPWHPDNIHKYLLDEDLERPNSDSSEDGSEMVT